ncbi:hypothetical protein OIV83_003946 [Microbotryomycetes sp. JL201]|nr:hypothetical protein OIV83_003946 [Microbotryomycetes sp. JL201]
MAAVPQDPPAELGNALLAWINSLKVEEPVDGADHGLEYSRDPAGVVPLTLYGLSDGITLGSILLRIDPIYFGTLASASSKTLSTNWVLRFNHLKRLYKLVMRYFEDTLKCSTTNLATPNLQLIAQADRSPEFETETCKLAGLVLALAVQSDQRLDFVNGIQSLDEWAQKDIMWSIENVMGRIGPKPASSDEQTEVDDTDGDSQFYALHQDRSQLLTDKDALQLAYDSLQQSFNSLKEEHESALSSLAKVEEAAKQAKFAQKDKPEVLQKAELERIKATLSKTEDQLTEVEQMAAEQQKIIEDLTRKVEELTPRAEEATRLKDQLDEHKHAAERLEKMEHVVEKYKKKLEEAGDVRRQIKSLEAENAELLDKYAALEEEHTKLAAESPQIAVFQAQIDKLQSKLSTAARESGQLRHELDLAAEREKELHSSRARDLESIAAMEERIRELETTTSHESAGRSDDEDLDEVDASLDGLSGTSLKLKLRRVQRELDSLRKGGNAVGSDGTISALQTELAEVERLREKYETEWITEHRKRLLLETRMEEIASGRSEHGDDPQACAALRQQLADATSTVEDLQSLCTRQESRIEEMVEQLNVAESNLELVDKDQLEALNALRQSVSVDKAVLKDQLAQARLDLQSAKDDLKLQTSQVNALLKEQVALQRDGIEQRDRLLERKSNDPEVEELKLKLKKAKEFIKQQDQQFRERYEAEDNGLSDEAAQEYESRIATLTDELSRQRSNTAELEVRYRREQQLMLAAWHDVGMQHMREGVATASGRLSSSRHQAQPTSWLAQQRARTVDKSLRYA